jgi:hypothetical protein
MTERLTSEQLELLNFLDENGGSDIWNYHDAVLGRELEKRGYVLISEAHNPNPDGAKRQPYFGIEISQEGQQALIRASKDQS